MNPFDFANSINYTKEYMMTGSDEEQGYNPFMVNRSLSYFSDTVVLANEMNKHHKIDNKMQYDFLFHLVRKRKRFSKWAKSDESELIDMIKEYYGYSSDKAASVADLFTDNEREALKAKLYKGGKTK